MGGIPSSRNSPGTTLALQRSSPSNHGPALACFRYPAGALPHPRILLKHAAALSCGRRRLLSSLQSLQLHPRCISCRSLAWRQRPRSLFLFPVDQIWIASNSLTQTRIQLDSDTKTDTLSTALKSLGVRQQQGPSWSAIAPHRFQKGDLGLKSPLTRTCGPSQGCRVFCP